MKSDFPDLLKRLNEFEVAYVLVGGMAANLDNPDISERF